jgi:hypothetical protein
MKLTISRKIWLRGTGLQGNSKLLRSKDSKMCCVGIYLEALGVPRDRLEDESSAHGLAMNDIPVEAKWLIKLDDGFVGRCTGSEEAYELYLTNDRDPREITDNEREDEVKRLFGRQGIEVTYE